MKIYKVRKQIERYESKALSLYFGRLRVGYFDIETTGLSPDSCKCMLIGIGGFAEEDDGNSASGSDSTVGGPADSDYNFTVTQFYAEELHEEQDILKAFWKECEKYDVLVSYNGHRFDWPFVFTRSEALGIPYPEKPPFDFDLYRIVNYHSPLRSMLPNLRQKTVEDFMGLWQYRDDRIDGGNSVDLYYEYLRTGDAQLKEGLCEIICLHNSDDVAQLARLMKVLTRCNLHEGMSHFGFPVPGTLETVVSQVELKQNRLLITGTAAAPDGEYFDYPLPYGYVKVEKHCFTISLPVEDGFDAEFIDMKGLGLDEGSPLLEDGMLDSGFAVLKTGDCVDFRMLNLCAMLIAERVL